MRRAAAMVLCCGLLWACSGDDDDVSDTTATRPDDHLDWGSCGDIECATLEVVVDHVDPAGPTLELTLARRRAGGDRIGALLLNPGGPGAPGIPLVENADQFLSSELLDRFDIVSWDPRGTGDSTSVDCGDRFDYFFSNDSSPDDAAEVSEGLADARRFADACADRSAALLPALSSTAIVDDMESIRVALAEPKLTYLGFSYGTYLGARYADKYPTHVRALVLDGAVDPSLTPAELARQQAIGFEEGLKAFLDDFAQSDCGFGGDDPTANYRRLMRQIDAEAIPAEVDGEERTLGPGEADLGVASALYAGEAGWQVLGPALNDAARGDGSELLRLADEYTGRQPGGTYDASQPAFFATSCLDATYPTAQQLPQVAADNAQVAPNFGASTTWLSSPCSVWPVPPATMPAAIRAAGAPPIVVIGTTNDPVTPLQWAQALASQLESGHLIVHRGEGHTAYGQGDACVDDAVDRYLVDLVLPAAGLTC